MSTPWTAPDGENRYLLVSIGGSTAIAASVTWDGVFLTKLVGEIGWPPVQQWGLANPAAGSHDLDITFANSAQAVVLGLVFAGVDQAASVIGVHAHGTDMANKSGAVDVSASQTDMVVDVVCTDFSTGTHTPASGQTLDGTSQTSDYSRVSFSHRQGASSMLWTWPDLPTGGNVGWSIAATTLKSAP